MRFVCINSGCKHWFGTFCSSREFCIWRRRGW